MCLFVVIVAGCGAGCRVGIHIDCGCRGCGAAHQLLNVPRLMQGRARQRVEQRHQQKHEVKSQGGDGAAQHEGMRIILKCGWLFDERVCGSAFDRGSREFLSRLRQQVQSSYQKSSQVLI